MRTFLLVLLCISDQVIGSCDKGQKFVAESNSCEACPKGQYNDAESHTLTTCKNQISCGPNNKFDPKDQETEGECILCDSDEYITAETHQHESCFKKRGWHELCTKDVECDYVGTEKTECKAEPQNILVLTCQKLSESSANISVSSFLYLILALVSLSL